MAAHANASSSGCAPGPRVRRVAVAALEAASSLETALPRRIGAGALPETPAGMPRRKARLQQTPSRRSARKASVAAATAPRTPEEIRASFNQLVASTAARYASGGGSATKTRARRRARSESEVSTQPSTPHAHRHATPGSGAAKRLPFASPASSVATLVFDSSDADEGSESDRDDDDAASAATLHRKRTQRHEQSLAAVRSSKQVRVRTCVLSALSPPRAPLPQGGNTAEDEELLQIQKRLVFGTRKPPPSPSPPSSPRASKRVEQCASPQYSRSGRLTVPPMEWWRNERLTTDRDGVTVFHAGSPAHIATPSRKARTAIKCAPASAPTSALKPPRVPKATSKTTTKATTKTTRKPVRAKTPVVKAKRAIKLPKAEADDAPEWTRAQLDALAAAKMQIPTTAANFWADVAAFVPGKSANECRTKSFEDFASPTQRKRKTKAHDATAMQIPAKLHRAGSNRFKKQVREFVQQLETKHVDDVFENTTPSKLALAGLDELQSPQAPLDTSATGDDDDDDDDDDPAYAGRRELKSSVPASKRDEVDSYVLRLKRSRILGDSTGATTTAMALRTSAIFTPSKDKPARKKMKRAVLMYEEVGAHRVEGVVSPGGTTRVRIDKDSDATSDDDDERDSDDEHSSDDAFV